MRWAFHGAVAREAAKFAAAARDLLSMGSQPWL